MEVLRLTPAHVALAQSTFALMSDVFEADDAPLSAGYVSRLLARDDFFASAAVVDGAPVGGLTAHVLPMTRAETDELMIYDLAVRQDRQRQGVGRALVEHARSWASARGMDAFVPAEDEDDHALAFYRSLGGEPTATTIFTFPAGG